MAHDHSHQHPQKIDSLNRAFIIGIVLNLGFVFAEFAAGFWLDSLALIADAGHNLSDVISLILALLAFRLAKVKANNRYTYGYKKSTVLVSLVNAVILLVAVGGILVESINKISNPAPVEGGTIAWIAAIGVLINGFTAYLFLKDKKRDLNVKGAYLHMVADALVSVGVVISGIVIQYTGRFIIDPIIGIAIAIVILVSTWSLLHDSIRLSLDGVPVDIDKKKIEELMNSVEGVEEVHHLHIWAISTTENALTAHIVMAKPEQMESVKAAVKEELAHHNITHATLEFEETRNDCHNHCEE